MERMKAQEFANKEYNEEIDLMDVLYEGQETFGDMEINLNEVQNIKVTDDNYNDVIIELSEDGDFLELENGLVGDFVYNTLTLFVKEEEIDKLYMNHDDLVRRLEDNVISYHPVQYSY